MLGVGGRARFAPGDRAGHANAKGSPSRIVGPMMPSKPILSRAALFRFPEDPEARVLALGEMFTGLTARTPSPDEMVVFRRDHGLSPVAPPVDRQSARVSPGSTPRRSA